MALDAILHPADAQEVLDLVAEAAETGVPIEVRSGGSKRDIGKPARDATIVDISALSGVVDYEPSELVLTVRPATPLTQVEALLATEGQMLAFEPWDHGALFGRARGAATIGGVVAAGVAGSRQLSAGGARDHLLGFTAVSGRGESFQAGGKVVKNVTGYDLSKVMAGSWGQLAVLTELSLKVVPKPRFATTLALSGLDARRAVAVMAKALGSRAMPAAAAHLPTMADRPALTLLRLEGFEESVEVRARQLTELLVANAETMRLSEADATKAWTEVSEAGLLRGTETLWRTHLAPSNAAALADALTQSGAQWCLDWAGASAWVGAPLEVNVRALADAHGAHALLVRAPEVVRRTTAIRHPEPPAVVEGGAGVGR